VLDALSALLAGASDDGGRLVLLAGEAGIGKTSVVRRLAECWDHQAVVVWVLHAWVWKKNPTGMFEDYNPRVAACP
jgi:AAA ATPase domain